MKERILSKVKIIAIMVSLFAVVYLVFEYLFPILFPILLAYLLAIFLHAIVIHTERYLKWKRSCLTGFYIILFLTIFAVFLFLLFKVIGIQVQQITNHWSYYQGCYRSYMIYFSDFIEQAFGVSAEDILGLLQSSLEKMGRDFQDNALQKMLNRSFGYLGSAANAMVNVVVVIITTFFLAKDFEEIKAKVKDQFWYRDLKRIYKKIVSASEIYLRAQLIIMMSVGAFIMLCLFLLKQPYALLLGALIGLLDALPFFGTGTIFIPWGIIRLIKGDLFHAACYLTIYVVTAFIREFLEPKLIGKRLGISPVFVIVSIYFGVQIYGLKGVFLGPLSLLVYFELLKEIMEKLSIDLKKL